MNKEQHFVLYKILWVSTLLSIFLDMIFNNFLTTTFYYINIILLAVNAIIFINKVKNDE